MENKVFFFFCFVKSFAELRSISLICDENARLPDANKTLLDVPFDGLFLVELRLLCEETNTNVVWDHHVTRELLVRARNDAKKGRFTAAVDTDHTNASFSFQLNGEAREQDATVREIPGVGKRERNRKRKKD